MLYTLSGHTDCVTGLDLSPDGEKLVSNGMDGTCRVWDVRPFASSNKRLVKTVSGHTHNYEKNLLRAKWSRDGLYFGAGSADRNLWIWEAESGNVKWKLGGHEGSVNCLAFHPNEDIVCSGSSDKTLFLGELGE